MIERTGPWSQTFTGRRWFPLEPRPTDVCIEDIAHALSMLCRFTGHVKRFYSVAQHSHLVSQLVPEPLALHGLLHDAQEAYVGDVASPLKRALNKTTAAYDLLEGNATFAIAIHFGLRKLTTAEAAAVKHADLVALMTERRDLLWDSGHSWSPELEAIVPDEETLAPWSPDTAKRLFLDRFRELTAGGTR